MDVALTEQGEQHDFRQLFYSFVDYDLCEPYTTFSIEGTPTNNFVTVNDPSKGYFSTWYEHGEFYEDVTFVATI